jgi:hypothetical protein
MRSRGGSGGFCERRALVALDAITALFRAVVRRARRGR